MIWTDSFLRSRHGILSVNLPSRPSGCRRQGVHGHTASKGGGGARTKPDGHGQAEPVQRVASKDDILQHHVAYATAHADARARAPPGPLPVRAATGGQHRATSLAAVANEAAHR